MSTLPSPSRLTACLALLLTACGDDGPSTTTAADGSTTTADGSTTTAETSTGPDGSTTVEASTGPDGSTTTAEASTGPGDTETATDDTTGSAGLEIAGQWLEEFAPGEGITHEIDEVTWQQLASFGDAIFHVSAYDDEERWVVAQADAANEFSPELYSRFDWTWDGDALYYCTAVFDAATAEDALAAPPSDPGDLEAGCAGFPWSLLVPIR